MRCKSFGTAKSGYENCRKKYFLTNSYLDNFSEKLERASSASKYAVAMEDAIQNYRGKVWFIKKYLTIYKIFFTGAAEKTFNFTKPGESFRNDADDSIGNIEISQLVVYKTICLREEQLQINKPSSNWFEQFKAI